MTPRPAVFLDRDGTVIEDVAYPSDPERVRLLPGAAEGIARLNRAGVPVVLVTNQSGIGRGYFTEDRFRAVQRRMLRLLAERGARIDAAYHCPHAPDRVPPCDCRKPLPGLFLRAARENGLDPARSWYVGDRARDLAPAAELGGTPVMVRGPGGAGEEPPPGVAVAGSLAEVAEMVLGALAAR